MIWLTWILGVGGLIVSSIGAILLYKGTPLDHTGMPTNLEWYGTTDEKEKFSNQFMRRRKQTQIGILCVGVGFVIQLTAQLVNIPI